MKNKNAFSFVELSIVLVIIGILTVVSTYTIQERFTDYYARYYTAYDALSKTAYNVYADTYCRTNTASEDNKTDCIRDDKEANPDEGITGTNYTKTGRPFPDNAKNLCKRFKEYLNATPMSECHDNTISKAKDSEFNSDNLQFVLSNGFRFYFSEPKTINIRHAGTQDKEVRYYIVYIDLNGKGAPNTAIFSDSNNKAIGVKPDIVPFIVTFKGDVIPVGNQVFDKTYVSARVLDFENNQTQSYTLDEARQLAFGNTPYIDMPMTLIPEFNKELPRKIRPTGTHHKFKIDSDRGVGIDEINEATKEKLDKFGCRKGTYTCVLKIDENLEKRY